MVIITELSNFLKIIITNKIFISATFAFFISQLLKILLILKNEKRFKFNFILRRTGMPSSHSATITALVLSLLIIEGITNITIFLFFLGIILIRDILDINLGIPKKNKLDFQLKTYIHKPLEVIVGILIGLIATLLTIYYF
jgi:uncharacterized protein